MIDEAIMPRQGPPPPRSAVDEEMRVVTDSVAGEEEVWFCQPWIPAARTRPERELTAMLAAVCAQLR